jgi:hypothetical protein
MRREHPFDVVTVSQVVNKISPPDSQVSVSSSLFSSFVVYVVIALRILVLSLRAYRTISRPTLTAVMGVFKKNTEGINPQQPQTDTISEKDLEKNFEDVKLEARQGSVDNGGSAPYIDPVIEKRVVRKIDMNLVPLLMALYLLAFLDRSNIGNAKIAGMAKALDLNADRYSWLLTIFYISYILFQFQVLGWKRFPPQ